MTAGHTKLTVPVVERPDVSVLMVTYGAREWVQRSLHALIEHTPPVYELIVVDNGSTDGTREYLRDGVQGARIIESPRNLGFGVGNDLAAVHARGDLLCFLNSDALVPTGWLDGLTAPFDDPRVGAVVPMYVFPDGSLQEAGVVVERDGRVVALGARGDANDPQWCVRRFVTYGSAACLLIRRSTFHVLGGFDPAYGLGYYEDVDLEFALRSVGLRVLLEPAVRVIHAQGASSPTHAEAVARRDANQERFRKRWATYVWHRPMMFGVPQPHRFSAARDIETPDRVLVLAPEIPRSSDPRHRMVTAMSSALDDGFVTLATLRASTEATALSGLLSAGVEVVAPDSWSAWLEQRRFHYSVIISSSGELREVGEALIDTQPQASVVAPPDERIVDDGAAFAIHFSGDTHGNLDTCG